MYLEVIAVLHYISMMTSFMRMSQKLVFHQSKCICAIKPILSTTAIYISWSSFMYLRISCYCDACLNSSALRVGVKTLLNTIEWLDQRFPNFERYPNLRLMKTPHTTTQASSTL